MGFIGKLFGIEGSRPPWQRCQFCGEYDLWGALPEQEVYQGHHNNCGSVWEYDERVGYGTVEGPVGEWEYDEVTRFYKRVD
jgi:hypothetical protein